MSYRYYIGVMPKKIYKELRKANSKKEIASIMNVQDKYDDEDDSLYSGDWLYKFKIKEVYDEAYILNKHKAYYKFFNKKELNDYYNDDETLYKIKQEDLLEFIQLYKTKVQKYYDAKFKKIQELTEEGKIKQANEIGLSEIRYKVSEWNIGAIDINLDTKYSICEAWSFEYAIFDLLFLYKTVNFNTHIVFINAG